MSKNLPAVFLDRDGTINIDHGYVYEIDKFEFIKGVIEACKELKEMGFALVLATNQSGIARGKYTEEQFLQLTEWMDWSLADHGIDLDGIYYCPHHLSATDNKYKLDCSCRKPKPGMLLTASKQLHLNMDLSYMVGDKWQDMQAGRAAGVGTTVLVRTGVPVSDKAISLADLVLDSVADLPAFIRNNKDIK